MKIVCLLKQVPEPTAIEFDEETKTLKREGVPLILNPFDRAAVAEAVRLRDGEGGEVVAMSMGPPQAEEALREAIGMGADRAILLSDRVFAVADTLGTSRTLALALQKEGFDLVLCGRKTVDSETWQVPPEVAAFLGVPHLTNVGLDRRGPRRPRDGHGRGGLRAAATRGRLDRACPDGHRAANRLGRDVDLQRPGRRRPGGRQALRPDGLADARPRRPRRDAGARRPVPFRRR